MEIIDAIDNAIKMEEKIREKYKIYASEIKEKSGQKFFLILSKEEEEHVKYLKNLKEEILQKKEPSFKEIPVLINSTKWIEECEEKIETIEEKHSKEGDFQRLLFALELEKEATKFYENLVKKSEGVLAKIFKKFLEIEESHTAIVQAELDYYGKSGYFFDFPEFSLESME